MNKKILAKILLPIATIALLGGGIASSFVLTSCSNKKDPSHYVGSMDGTDWKGWVSGHVDFAIETDDSYTLDLSDNLIEYSARNLVIPYKVKDNNDNEYYVKKIIGANGYPRSYLILTGTLTIPDSVTNIDEGAFTVCPELTKVIIPNSVTSIGNSAFAHCIGLTESLTIPNSVASISGWAFIGCSGLTGSLTIPDSVTSIGESAFADCSGLTGSLTIPDSVTSIGNETFQGCSGFNNITLDGFDSEPSWGGSEIFTNWNASGGTVSEINGIWNVNEALTFIKTKGLNENWNAA